MTTLYSPLLHARTHIHTFVSTVTSSLSLLGSGLQRQTFPFFRVPCHLPQLSGSNRNDWISAVVFTYWLRLLSCRAYNISTRIAQKTPSLCCCEIVTVELSCSCLLAEPLANKGCYTGIVVYRNGSTCHNTLNWRSFIIHLLFRNLKITLINNNFVC
jgi:hypothetical protein